MQWDWNREPASSEEVSELMGCLGLLFGSTLGSGADLWHWGADSSKCFSVKSARKLISGSADTSLRFRFVWNNWVPIKVNAFG
ncbi:hypothetical protein Hdeb2414_s0033g00722411 [Helianthus debilis subsp. tardiflorus]